MTSTIGLPIKAYIKQYVLFKQNILEPGKDVTLDLSSPGEIPYVLKTALEGKLKTKDCYDPSFYHYDATLLLSIPKWENDHSRIRLTLSGIRIANEFLLRDFQEYVLSRVLWGKKYQINEHDSLHEIINEIGLHDLISIDALKKTSYRLRTRKKIKNFR